MLNSLFTDITIHGKKLRDFLMFGIYKEVNYKSFLKSSFLKNNIIKNKIKKHV